MKVQEVRLKNFVGFVVVVLISVLCYFLISSFLRFFSNSSDNIKAASITAFVSVSIFMIGRYAEQKRELKQKVNSEKVQVYKRFFDMYFGLFSPNNRDNEGRMDGDPDLTQEIYDFQRDLMVWGSDAVIRDWLRLKEELILFSDRDLTDALEAQAKVFVCASKLLASMRRDLGYTFTSFSAKDLILMQMKSDNDRLSLLEYARKLK